MENSLTHGKIGRGLILFIIPLFASSLIQQMYSTVDLMFVGRFLGTEASAAVGATSLLVTCLVGFFNGMSVGASVYAAQYFGGQRWDRLKKLIRTIVWMGLIGGLLLTVFGYLFTPTFLRWMGTPNEIFALAQEYLQIYLLSMIALIIYNLGSGTVRSMGDSKTPLIFQFFGGLINIAADYICIVILHMGVQGTAWATFASQTFAAVCVIVYLWRIKADYALRFTLRDFSGREFKKVLAIGVPAGVQSMIMTFSNLVIQSQINRLGVTAIAAFTIYFRLELIVWLPIVALGQAVVAFVGQNYGADNMERLKKGMRYCLIGGMLFIGGLSIISLRFNSFLSGFFTTDAAVIEQTKKVLWSTFPFYSFVVMVECFSSNLKGYGRAIVPMIIAVICYVGIRLGALFFFMNRFHTAHGVAFAWPVSWCAATVCLGIAVYQNSRKQIKIKTK